MKTITLTASEINTLETYLFENPCISGCIMDYKRIDCHDLNEDGEYKCKLRYDRESILRKIGYYGKKKG